MLGLRYWFNYRIVGNDVFVDSYMKRGAREPTLCDPALWAGELRDICSSQNMATTMYDNLKKGWTKSMADMEAVERKAERDGRQFADWMLWLKGPEAATIPLGIAMGEGKVRARMLGHTDPDSFTAFMSGFQDEMNGYRVANTKLSIAPAQTE